MRELRFLTKNAGKFDELKLLMRSTRYRLIRDETDIKEIQTENMNELVRDKTLKAFAEVRRPLIVDHTGLEFDLLNGFPSGLTSVFYEKLKAKGIADLIGVSSNNRVTAITLLGYCDGRKIKIFRGSLKGKVAPEPRERKGRKGFQWDSIFIPNGYAQTFWEMGTTKKNEISMRRLAFDKLVKYLKGG
jgi:XTP/dITP diphosphohydrolase